MSSHHKITALMLSLELVVIKLNMYHDVCTSSTCVNNESRLFEKDKVHEIDIKYTITLNMFKKN